MVGFFFFFFSSRRRHTRWPRDWSSDVCSSDLSAELRDSLLNLRGGAAPRAASPQEYAEQGNALFGGIPFLEDIASWRPGDAFDWVIVGTGAVALLSGLALAIGLFAGKKKKRGAAPRKQKQQVSRKI